MIRVREVLVVEGKYDKNTLLQVVDATVITTDGFGIFRDADKRKLLRKLAQERGLILLTDSDGAGFLIRQHLRGFLSGLPIKHAYVPDILGKEKRKRLTSREGLLGVEGMRPKALLAALTRAGATFEDAETEPTRFGGVTKADFMEDGLSGCDGSAARRARLQKSLDLPARMTANALLEFINLLYDRETYKKLVADL